ncbi:MAG: GC-type dockerin domain-anchored protein [Planctomycetota bacterium]
MGALSVFTAAGTAHADVLSVSFVGDLVSYTGPASQDPFNPATPLGSAIAANPDLARLDGQFIVRNFDPSIPGTQVFVFAPGTGSSPDVEFFLHTPVLERVEALTTRLGTGNPSGVPVNTKILLPRTVNSTTTDEVDVTTTGFFGTGTLTVVDGVPVSLEYTQGPDTLQSFDFRFNPISLEELSLSSDGGSFSLEATYDLDTPGAADDAPYGFNTTLSAFPGSTVLTTTRGVILAELAAGTILNTRESQGGVPIANPLTGTGTWFQYTASGVGASVEAVDERCSPADIAQPFGELNFFDIAGYLALFAVDNPAADIAEPFGEFNFFDVSAFVGVYNAGCP